MFFHAYRMRRAIHFHTTETRCVNLLLLWFSKCVPFDQHSFADQMQVELGFFVTLPQWFLVKSTCSVPKDLIAKKRNKRNIRDQMLINSINKSFQGFP